MCQCGGELSRDRYLSILGTLADLRILAVENFRKQEEYMATNSERIAALTDRINELSAQLGKVATEVTNAMQLATDKLNRLIEEARQNSVDSGVIDEAESAITELSVAAQKLDDLNADATPEPGVDEIPATEEPGAETDEPEPEEPGEVTEVPGGWLETESDVEQGSDDRGDTPTV